MRLIDLPEACKGQSDQKIKDLIESTDEYQAMLADGGGAQLSRNMFNTGVLLVRHERDNVRDAMIQAAEQGMVADGAQLIAESGQELTWVPSGPFNEVLAGKNDSFVAFLINGTDLKLDDPNTTFNCWEAVIVAAIVAKVIENGTGLVALYNGDHSVFSKTLSQALVAGASRPYKSGSLLQSPVCGDIVLFDGLAHVAIATGDSDNTGNYVLSFWPAPEKSAKQFGKNGTRTTMLLTTIEALGAWMNLTFGRAPKITFGSPSWQVLNQK
jgi:hypothetical protein